jgi:hypothetical protein
LLLKYFKNILTNLEWEREREKVDSDLEKTLTTDCHVIDSLVYSYIFYVSISSWRIVIWLVVGIGYRGWKIAARVLSWLFCVRHWFYWSWMKNGIFCSSSRWVKLKMSSKTKKKIQSVKEREKETVGKREIFTNTLGNL